jgi:hypothetical protein
MARAWCERCGTVARETPPVGRIDELVALTNGAAELVRPRDAWAAAEIVTDRFATNSWPGGSPALPRLMNWFRLAFVTRTITNRDRTAIIGVGGTRPAAIVAVSVLGGWLAPKLPKPLLFGVVGTVAVVAARRHRLRRLLWISRTLRRADRDLLLVGEFAAREPGAGVVFANDAIKAIGAHVSLALTVQGERQDRRVRSLIRLYERRLGFEIFARQTVGTEDWVLMIRRATPLVPTPNAA